MTIRAFIDIDVGDREEYENTMKRYESFRTFVCTTALKQLGRGGGGGGAQGNDDTVMETLSQDDIDLCVAMFQGDPACTYSDGKVETVKPSIRAGRLVIDLDNEGCPRACENFKCLCTGERGKSKQSGKPMHYKGSMLHRIVKGFVMQGGDFLFGDGRGGETIYGMKFGKDEMAGLKKQHKFGSLAMANGGKPNSSSSQFYFVTCSSDNAAGCKKLKKLDGKHVIFGDVVDGLDVLKVIGTLLFHLFAFVLHIQKK